MSEVVLDADRQVRARRLSFWLHTLDLARMVAAAGYSVTWIAAGWNTAMGHTIAQGQIAGWADGHIAQVLLFAAIFAGGYVPISLTLDAIGFGLSRRFGLARQSIAAWLLDQLKIFALAGVLGAILLSVLYVCMSHYPQTWWLIVAGVLLVLNVMLVRLAPVVLFPLFFRFKPLADEHAELAERVRTLADRARTQIAGVFSFDMSHKTSAANAALAGMGRTRRVILSDTLIREFSPDEVEVVVAHELGHHVHGDIARLVALSSVLTLGGLYMASWGLQAAAETLGLAGIADPAGLPVLLLILGAYNLMITPIENAVSRSAEYRADAFAVELTAKPQAFTTAMTRLANQNLADVEPPGWLEWWLHSHPSLTKRMARVMALAKT